MNAVESLEGFLGRIEAHLGDLPDAHRIEILVEARDHLKAMIAANRGDGLNEAAAWEKAARGFGDADEIGRELAREWKRAPRVETVGTPLSRREKLKSFALPIVVSLLFFGILWGWMSDERLKSYQVIALMALSSLGCLLFGVWHGQRSLAQWTPANVFSFGICFLMLLQSNVRFMFGPQLRGTIWDTISGVFPLVMLPLLLLSLHWRKRESRNTLPWRQMSGYARNPIAAEETFRLAPKIGLAMGVTMGCMGNLMMARFIGWTPALALCGGEIIFALIFARWLGRAS